MTAVRLTTWRGIPLLVTARDAADEVTVPLSLGFQDLVDRVAGQEGLTDEEAYLDGWGVEEAGARPGPARAVAAAVAAELEGQIEALRCQHLGGSAGVRLAPGPADPTG